jgi:hypothetical protein
MGANNKQSKEDNMDKTYALITYNDNGTVQSIVEQTTSSPADQVATRLWRVARNERVAAAAFVEASELRTEVSNAPLYKWENIFRPVIRHEDFKRLLRHYNRAKNAGHEDFVFKNSKGYPCPLNTRYAHYLLEYLRDHR